VLLDHGADVDSVGPMGTPLVVAASQGHTSVVEVLLDHGADIEGGLSRKTPLFEAVRAGSAATVAVLIRHGANVNMHGGGTFRGATPLHEAVIWPSASLEIVELLVRAGADVNVRDDVLKLTPLEMARRNTGQNRSKIVEFLERQSRGGTEVIESKEPDVHPVCEVK